MSKTQDAFFIGVIALMLLGTAAINQAQAAPVQKQSARSYKVKGVRYYPLQNADNFTQTGKASWYGPGFHGKKTSNGERYNMNALTAAHKTLPLGSLVRVSNLGNGKSIVVRINDRGPFHGSRIIDLSKAAAGKLGFLSKGMAQVRVESLSKKNAVIAAGAETAAPDTVQTAALPAPSLLKTAAPSRPEALTARLTANTLNVPLSQTAQAVANALPQQPLYLNSERFVSASEANLFLLQTAEKLDVAKLNYPMSVEKSAEGYSVRIGPFQKAEQMMQLREHLVRK